MTPPKPFEEPRALDLLAQFRERYGRALDLQNAYDVDRFGPELHQLIQSFVLEAIKPWQQAFTDAVMRGAGLLTPAPEPKPKRSTHQPLVTDQHGTRRFKGNAVVSHLLDLCGSRGIADMNTLALGNFSDEDRAQFAELIGYSVSGFSELSYVSEEIFAEATAGEKEAE